MRGNTGRYVTVRKSGGGFRRHVDQLRKATSRLRIRSGLTRHCVQSVLEYVDPLAGQCLIMRHDTDGRCRYHGHWQLAATATRSVTARRGGRVVGAERCVVSDHAIQSAGDVVATRRIAPCRRQHAENHCRDETQRVTTKWADNKRHVDHSNRLRTVGSV